MKYELYFEFQPNLANLQPETKRIICLIYLSCNEKNYIHFSLEYVRQSIDDWFSGLC